MQRKSLLSALGAAVMASAFVQCKPRNFNAKQSSAEGDKPPLVVIQCMAPQGNGGNWSSTLGWIAEEWDLRADQAKNIGGEGSWIYLACASGGSSGSGATNVLMNLLSNEGLFGAGFDKGSAAVARRSKGFYTPKETKQLARAVRVIAMSADLSPRERADFFGLVLEQTLAGKLQSSWIGDDTLRAIKELKKRDDPNNSIKEGGVCSNKNGADAWWYEQAADPCDAYVYFAKYAWTAKMMTDELLNPPLSTLGRHEGIAAKYGMKFVSDLTRLQPLNKPLDFLVSKDEAKALTEMQHAQSDVLDKAIDAFVRGEVKRRGLTSRYAPFNRWEFPRAIVHSASLGSNDDHPIASDMLRHGLRPGFFTITTAMMVRAKEFPAQLKPKAPNYKDLRYLVLGSRETMEAIAKSPLLHKHLDSEACRIPASGVGYDPCYPRRFILAVVDRAMYSMQPSVREPKLIEPLVARAYVGNAVGAQHMGITRLLDLTKPFNRQAPEFENLTKAPGREPLPGEHIFFGVTGGWPDRRITAWLQPYMMDSLLRNGLKDAVKGAPLLGFLSTFGKPDSSGSDKEDQLVSSVTTSDRATTPGADKFDTKSVREMFSTALDGQANVDDYVKFQKAFYEVWSAQALSQAFGFPFAHVETSVNWDVSKHAAMLVGKSAYLVQLSANAVREGSLLNPILDGTQQCTAVVTNNPKIGRSQCSRVMIPNLEMEGKGNVQMLWLKSVERIRAQSAFTFNPADARFPALESGK